MYEYGRTGSRGWRRLPAAEARLAACQQQRLTPLTPCTAHLRPPPARSLHRTPAVPPAQTHYDEDFGYVVAARHSACTGCYGCAGHVGVSHTLRPLTASVIVQCKWLTLCRVTSAKRSVQHGALSPAVLGSELTSARSREGGR